MCASGDGRGRGSVLLDGDSKSRSADDRWLWRQAVQLVGQLPENEDDALCVLVFAYYILRQAPHSKLSQTNNFSPA